MSLESARRASSSVLAVVLPLFILVEVNRAHLSPHGQLVVFAALGLTLVFLRKREDASRWLRISDLVLAAVSLAVGVYLLVQTEPWFSALWWGEQSLGARAGAEPVADLVVGAVGLVLVLEAARRSLGWALPILSLVFLLYGRFGSSLPDALMPHRGYDWERLVSQTFLHSQGVFGVALQVMLVYVFLFLLFGALLEATGATGFVLDATKRLFRGRSGGSAKVAVLSSGLLGSLSGSAVANTATTGTFTIPMMRSAGFTARTAAGLEAAASSGGALVPPVMGAGAYMMLEIITPPVTYLEIIRAALLPAILYYLALLWIVHWRALRIEAEAGAREVDEPAEAGDSAEVAGSDETAGLWRFEGLIFATGLGLLLAFLLVGYSVFRSVTLAALGAWALSFLSSRTRLSLRQLLGVLKRSSESGIALIAAAASVGVILGVVTLTGLGSRLPAMLLPLAEQNLLGALAALMVSSIVLGMGLPSAVCYLLLATLVGPVLGNLGVVPLAAHLFIFYFGMMSMVTPPVALAAYAASSISGSPLMSTAFAAFRFALVGFTLPYLFVFRPQLLMLDPSGEIASWGAVALAFLLAALGIAPFAAAIAGWLRGRLAGWTRGVLYLSAALALFPGEGPILRSAHVSVWNLLGIGLFVGVYTFQLLRTRSSGG